MKGISTSKALLWLVILIGLASLCAGVEPTTNVLVGYGMILAAVIYNRLDSRRQSYKLTAECGPAKIGLEAGGDNDHKN